MSDWLLYARQYASSRIVREHETDQVGLMLTSSEIIVSNENGVQVAPLHQIARVGKDVGQLLIVSSEQELIRATVDLSTETLGAFFAEAREVAAQARVAATEKAKLAEQTKQRAEREAQAKLEAERLQAQRVADEKKVLEENQKFGRTPGVAASVRPEDLMARGERVTRVVPPVTVVEPEIQNEIFFDAAPISKRFWAYFLDSFLLGVVNRGVAFALAGPNMQLPVGVLTLFIGWLYFAFAEASPLQGTFGKLALGIQVVNHQHGRVNLGISTLRNLIKTFAPYAAIIVVFVVAFPLINQNRQPLTEVQLEAQILAELPSDPTKWTERAIENAQKKVLQRNNPGVPFFLYVICFFIALAPCMVAFFNPLGRALHDLMLNTVVINR